MVEEEVQPLAMKTAAWGAAALASVKGALGVVVGQPLQFVERVALVAGVAVTMAIQQSLELGVWVGVAAAELETHLRAQVTAAALAR
jgi:hypothetical protein